MILINLIKLNGAITKTISRCNSQAISSEKNEQNNWIKFRCAYRMASFSRSVSIFLSPSVESMRVVRKLRPQRHPVNSSFTIQSSLHISYLVINNTSNFTLLIASHLTFWLVHDSHTAHDLLYILHMGDVNSWNLHAYHTYHLDQKQYIFSETKRFSHQSRSQWKTKQAKPQNQKLPHKRMKWSEFFFCGQSQPTQNRACIFFCFNYTWQRQQ